MKRKCSSPVHNGLMQKVNIFCIGNDQLHKFHTSTKNCANWMRVSCWFLYVSEKSAITFGEVCSVLITLCHVCGLVFFRNPTRRVLICTPGLTLTTIAKQNALSRRIRAFPEWCYGRQKIALVYICSFCESCSGIPRIILLSLKITHTSVRIHTSKMNAGNRMGLSCITGKTK